MNAAHTELGYHVTASHPLPFCVTLKDDIKIEMGLDRKNILHPCISQSSTTESGFHFNFFGGDKSGCARLGFEHLEGCAHAPAFVEEPIGTPSLSNDL